MNSPESLVREMCQGIVIAHPELAFNSKYKIIRKKELNRDKVTLISGGGSGHEPAHAGFVGKGLLDAAVCGDVFASPSQIQVYQAIKESASQKGTLLIIKNYSGDIMNFKNAAYLATDDGINVDYIKVDDDVAVEDSLYTVGRRGVAGTLFVHKIAGAAAECGYELQEVKRLAQKAADHVRSIGFAFTSCTVPAKGTPTFQLNEDEMEYGVGIHGEPGIQKEKLLTADELASRMVERLLSELKIGASNKKVALLVNGFGATPLQELYLLNHSVSRRLVENGCELAFILVGNYMTSIDMAGASISVMTLDDELENLLNMTCDAPGLKIAQSSTGQVRDKIGYSERSVASEFVVAKRTPSAIIKNERIHYENMLFLIQSMGDIIIENEIPFCELDSFAGDGDFGMSVAKGFKQLRKEWNTLVNDYSGSIGEFLEACAMVIMEHCGGASGPIWGSAFRAAGKNIGNLQELSMEDFASMLDAAVKGIQRTGERSFGKGAGVGDKTLMDALIPCAESWKVCAGQSAAFREGFEKGALAAIVGAKSTENIVARMGRAGTVGERSLGHPDAGAHALGVIFSQLCERIIFE